MRFIYLQYEFYGETNIIDLRNEYHLINLFFTRNQFLRFYYIVMLYI